jgi:hypothetical protein
VTRRQHELRFLLAAAVIATLMAILGLRLLTQRWKPSLVGVAIILISNLIWVPAAFWVSRGRKGLFTALLFGATSPFIASIFLFPPWSLTIIVPQLWSALAVGVATGAAIYALSRTAWRADRGGAA